MTISDHGRIIDRAAACLTGVTLEAIGLPWEMLSAEEIRTRIGDLPLAAYLPFPNPSFFGKTRIPVGDASDDWQLTCAVAKALVRANGTVDHVLMAEEHVTTARAIGTNGWGGTTKTAVRAWDAFFKSNGSLGRHPAIPADGNGAGNGIAMKIAPLAIVAAATFPEPTEQTLWDACFSIGAMTHGDARASVAAHVLRSAQCRLFREEGDVVRYTPAERGAFVSALARLAETAEERLPAARRNEPAFSTFLTALAEHLNDPAMTITTLAQHTGTACVVWESVPFSIGAFLLCPGDVPMAVAKIIAGGGDTDTNVGMYGSLAGARNGMKVFPADWIAAIPAAAEAPALAHTLIAIPTRSST